MQAPGPAPSARPMFPLTAAPIVGVRLRDRRTEEGPMMVWVPSAEAVPSGKAGERLGWPGTAKR